MSAQRKKWMQEYSDSEIRMGIVSTGISLPVIIALILRSGCYSWLAWIVICDFVLLGAWIMYEGIVELKHRKENHDA